MMKIYWLRWGRECELTLILGRLQIRLGTEQQAAWWALTSSKNGHYKTLFNTGRRVRAGLAAIREQHGGA